MQRRSPAARARQAVCSQNRDGYEVEQGGGGSEVRFQQGCCQGARPGVRFWPVSLMIAFITIKSSLVPLIEGLCAQIYFRFEISVVCSHLLLFFFVKEKTC